MMTNRILTLISNAFSDLNLADMETGHKVFRREVIQSITLEEDRFGIEPEMESSSRKGVMCSLKSRLPTAAEPTARGKNRHQGCISRVVCNGDIQRQETSFNWTRTNLSSSAGSPGLTESQR
jgi:hypothetical protein